MLYKFDKLKAAIESSLRELKRPREERLQSIKQFVGGNYAEGGSDLAVPVNLIELASTIYVRHLASRGPRVMVQSKVDELKPFAATMEIALNQIPDEIGLESVFRKTVLAALFGLGVAKVGICAGGEDYEGHDVGKTFVDLVPFDDYFCDMSAKTWEARAYEGNDHLVTLEQAVALGYKKHGETTGDDHEVVNEQGEQRAESISTKGGADVYGEMIKLRDVWLPRENLIITYAVKGGQLLREVEWDGPECGPYHTLAFIDVPGNLLPLPSVALWRDLHELANEVFRKLARQAIEKKRVVTFQGGHDDEVEALKGAKDGEGICVNGMESGVIEIGGIDAESLGLFITIRDLFSYMGGNLDSLGGLASVAETAAQSQEISDAAGARMASMKTRTLAFAKSVWRALAWFEWTNPVRKRQVTRTTDDPDVSMSVEWSPETREGDFLDYNLDVDPFSMDDDSPQVTMQKLLAVLERVVFPMLPLMQAQGAQFDFRGLIETLARLGNLDELRGLVRFGEPIMGQAQAGGSEVPSFKPATTTRNYVRESRSNPTRSAKDGILARALMGGGTQGSERASLAKGTA